MLHESHETSWSTPPPGQPGPPGRGGATNRAGARPDTWRAEHPGGDGEGVPELEVRAHDVAGDAVVVRATGEIDLASASALREELTRACARADDQRVVLDLAEVDFLASAGLRVLAEIHNLCRRCALTFEVVNPRRPVLRSLRLSGLDRVLSLHLPPATRDEPD
jgi:anti-sigma B factor antagonist